MSYVVMLDAGHGGWDPGASYYGRQEKNDNLNLALAARAQYGFSMRNRIFFARMTQKY